MDRNQLMRFQTLFEQQKNNLIYTNSIMDESFHLPQEEMMDDVDMMSSELETSMRIRLRNRETLFLKKIDQALQRIQDGSFGDCEKCGESIEARRLEARPTTSMCVSCKEDQERREHLHIDGHKRKSLGVRVRFA